MGAKLTREGQELEPCRAPHVGVWRARPQTGVEPRVAGRAPAPPRAAAEPRQLQADVFQPLSPSFMVLKRRVGRWSRRSGAKCLVCTLSLPERRFPVRARQTGPWWTSAVFVVLGHASPGATDVRASMCLWVVGSRRRHRAEPESRGRTAVHTVPAHRCSLCGNYSPPPGFL